MKTIKSLNNIFDGEDYLIVNGTLNTKRNKLVSIEYYSFGVTVPSVGQRFDFPVYACNFGDGEVQILPADKYTSSWEDIDEAN